MKSGAFADDSKGKRHYMGVYEQEEDYKRFACLGAKKYAYEDSAGELHITIAGVNKAKGAEELANNGGLETFIACANPETEFTFNDAGGLEAVYNDLADPVLENVNGRLFQITSNVCLRPSTYTLGITEEYRVILEMCGLDLERLPLF